MPTGYTAQIYNGHPVTLRDFAFGCARAFGALVHMRDAPMDAPIPAKIEPDIAYHEEELRVARTRFTHLLALDDAGIAAECVSHNREQRERYEEHQLEIGRLRASYNALLEETRRHPFPKELESLREFMIQQLERSMEYDCYDWNPPIPMTPEEYRTMELGKARNDITYHTDEIIKEMDGAARRNEWLQALIASFPEES